MEEKDMGFLYIVPSPIGNLRDISLRALDALESSDLIACEDTRHSRILLDTYKIKKPLISYHEHNEKKATEEIIYLIREKKTISLISDAGMPAISDPGSVLIDRMKEEGLPYTVLPGPNAALTGLVASGSKYKHFSYLGFLPIKKKERSLLFYEMKSFCNPIIIYEAPHRIRETLNDLKENFPDSRVFLARELTKKFEEYKEIDLSAYDPQDIMERGEYVIVLYLSEKEEEVDIKSLLKEAIDSGMTKKSAIDFISKKYNLPKNDVYKKALEIK